MRPFFACCQHHCIFQVALILPLALVFLRPPPELPAELEKLELWLKRSLDYAASLPAKKKKK